ncbi:NAD-dependent epimerase/dehydratase family protein [Danxiaibacter flavus]|uniref:NAD-dependent epimerase/dehydratase family protein n=1 Tax=Danxiaibacter flavus TaxID=3049108 RepID=A0ABV3ZFH3_9BACT|nr:NAD-dependent epimerase/dehydratase family protein [Chitinophagaceae bacterium DXS]
MEAVNQNDKQPASASLQNMDLVLVTGANGLVGSELVQQLAGTGKRVRALYHRSKPQIQLTGVEWVQADILDVIELEDAMKGVSEVYHCAAIVSFSPKRRKLIHQTNIDGTENVVNACIDNNIRKLVYVSSVAAIGRKKDQEHVDEELKWDDHMHNSAYAKSKFLAEMSVWRGIGEGLDAVIVNPTVILGAGDWNKGSSELFKSIYKEFPWYSEGVNGFVDVQDVASVMIQLMESNISAQRFIVSAENISYKELFTSIANGFGKKVPHKRVTPFIAAVVWRLEAIKSFFSGKDPMITKETANTAQSKVYYDNTKLLKFLPGFYYTPLTQSIQRICKQLEKSA